MPDNTSRRRFLTTAAMTAGVSLALPRWARAAKELDSRVAKIVADTIGVDTHNHIDVPMTADAMPGPDLDIAEEMKRSGLSVICMTFATDYQPGDPYDRFLKALSSMGRQLERNGMKRSLSIDDVHATHQTHQPTVIQAVEGAHFLEGKLERVQEAYGHGLRHLGLLHDSDASVPLGDVYTNPPRFGGLTAFGASVIKECNRLGILVDLAHCDLQTTQAALKLSTRPALVSHTGLDTQVGSDPHMAQMMKPRLISKQQAKMVADAGGAIGVWTHLSDSPLEYAKNVRALVNVIGIGHVCIGTDTKLTPPLPWGNARPGGGSPAGGPPPNDSRPKGPGPDRDAVGRPQPRGGGRTNQAWADQQAGFYYVVVDAMLKIGFTSSEIGKFGGGNYLRVFSEAVKK